MKRKIYLFISVLLALLCFQACSDSGEEIDTQTLLQIYNRPYQLSGGVIWENKPNRLITTEPYVFEDIYTDTDGTEVMDRVEGYVAGAKIRENGNFVLTLFETGLTYNENLECTVGQGACICFHLASSETGILKPGKYVYAKSKESDTFTAFVSSAYDSESNIVPAEISEGEMTIAKTGEQYTVTFSCKTSFGGEVVGEYQGTLYQAKVNEQISAFYEDLALAGLLDSVEFTEQWLGDDPYTGIMLDTDNGAAFLSTKTGTCQYASEGGKELVDIALVWDKKLEAFYFESPLRMRSLLGHDDNYNFACHTVYMRAPNTFTDADFQQFSEASFNFDIQEEKVIFKTADFQPGYVFFKTGNGAQGVIRVKDFTPLRIETTSEFDGIFFITAPKNPILHIDVKCPSNIVEAKIR